MVLESHNWQESRRRKNFEVPSGGLIFVGFENTSDAAGADFAELLKGVGVRLIVKVGGLGCV